MSSGRFLVLAASVTATAGAAGLAVFGTAPVHMFGVMTVRITPEGMDPLPEAMGHFLPATICAVLLALGVTAACAGFGLPSRRRSISLVGRILAALGGAGMIVAAFPVATGLFGMRRALQIMATAATAPKPEELQTAIDQSAPLLTVGYGVLVAGTVLTLLAALVGFRKRPTNRWFAVKPLLPTAVAALAGLCYAAMFFLCWHHGSALESLLQPGTQPNPAELATHLNAILTHSLLGSLMLMLLGAALAMSGLLAQKPRVD